MDIRDRRFRRRSRRFWIANEDIHYVGGGALVTGSFAPCTASESSVRGPVEGFGVLLGLV